MCKWFHIWNSESSFLSSNFFSILSKLAQSILGEDLIETIWSTKIKSFSDLEPKLSANIETGHLQCQIHAALAGMNLLFEVLAVWYLCGKGIPCQAAFDNVCTHFSPLIMPQLDQIDDPTFWSEILCWAATGSMLLPSTSVVVNSFMQSQNWLLIFWHFCFRSQLLMTPLVLMPLLTAGQPWPVKARLHSRHQVFGMIRLRLDKVLK